MSLASAPTTVAPGDGPHTLSTLQSLRALYPAPKERAVRKQLDHLDVHCRRFIELSPFVVLAKKTSDSTIIRLVIAHLP